MTGRKMGEQIRHSLAESLKKSRSGKKKERQPDERKNGSVLFDSRLKRPAKQNDSA